MNGVAITVSVGELIDRITILELKQLHGLPVANELAMLWTAAPPLSAEVYSLVAHLRRINHALWDAEDAIRQRVTLEVAREIHTLNDLRARLKRQINDLVGCDITEEKVYSCKK